MLLPCDSVEWNSPVPFILNKQEKKTAVSLVQFIKQCSTLHDSFDTQLVIQRRSVKGCAKGSAIQAKERARKVVDLLQIYVAHFDAQLS